MNHLKSTLQLLLVFFVFLAGNPDLQADLVNITDGTSTFQWDPDDGTNSLSSDYGNYFAKFSPLLRYTNTVEGLKTRGLANFTGSGVKKAAVSHTVVNVGNSAVMNVTFGTQNGLSPVVEDLNMTLVFSVGTNEYGGVLDYAMAVQNVSGRDLDVELFSYYDWDIVTNQNSGSDFVWRDYDGFVQVGSGGPDQQVFHGTSSLQNWEVAAWNTLESKLLSNGDLSNSGTPFATADMTAAFGWDLGTMADGETRGVTLLIEAIPEPNSALLLAITCFAASLVRRRK
ncbi:MAG: PEP-CTERM sorting domain-containing protein [Mariniblastus sp.]|nr:PEP-CTERM sorting domain-containing protein [Mariniblastus sp.]